MTFCDNSLSRRLERTEGRACVQYADAAASFSGERGGLQSALLRERMRYAAERGCDLAMMVAEAGSESQRNAERQGFRIAYTRLKWRLTDEPA